MYPVTYQKEKQLFGQDKGAFSIFIDSVEKYRIYDN